MSDTKEGHSQAIPIWGDSIPTSNVKTAIREYNPFTRIYLNLKRKENPYIVPFLLHSDKPKPVIIVAPGGAYIVRASHEQIPIAKWLNSIGISSFILQYRHAPFRFPIPFVDAQRAIRFIRYNAKKFNIDPNRIGMIGFSAGGHLTASIGTLQQRNWFPNSYKTDAIDAISDALRVQILCYPVIDMNLNPHRGSRFNLLGKKPDPNLLITLSLHNQVNNFTSPTFIWTTHPDRLVPFSHSVDFTEALKKNNIDG
jgi:acetyl esterase/lipase